MDNNNQEKLLETNKENNSNQNVAKEKKSLGKKIFEAVLMIIFLAAGITPIYLLVQTFNDAEDSLYDKKVEENASSIYKEMSEKELLGCYSDLEIINLSDKSSVREVRLIANQEFSKSCFEQYLSMHTKLNNTLIISRHKNTIPYKVSIQDVDGRIFSYKNAKEINANNDEEFLKYRIFAN